MPKILVSTLILYSKRDKNSIQDANFLSQQNRRQEYHTPPLINMLRRFIMSAIESGIYHKYYRPFGCPAREVQTAPKSLFSTSLSVLQRALPGAIIGSYFGGVYPGSILGGVIGLTATSCANVIQNLWRKRNLYNQEPVVNDPLLGKYQKANVKLLSASSSFATKKALIASAKNSIEIIGSYAGGVHFQKSLIL